MPFFFLEGGRARVIIMGCVMSGEGVYELSVKFYPLCGERLTLSPDHDQSAGSLGGAPERPRTRGQLF